ncbi:MAG: hypothetical protein M1827_003293 [Pycnora praestabilis]|nr:MAG: hypothetical protein M1827_003293 [Pycnora praestabilis]
MTRGASLDTPPLRVSRPVSACSRCRIAKVKCDGRLPACTACEKSGKGDDCSSANDEFAKGKERSYVASLESRVERLNKQIAQTKARKASVTMLGSESGPLTANVEGSHDYGNSTRPMSGKAAQRKESSNIDELVSDFGFLAVNATARDFYGFNPAMSYSRLIMSASSKRSIDLLLAKAFPTHSAAIPLIQHYLNHILVFYPFFSETAFFASVDAIYRRTGSTASDFDKWAVNLVLAIASLSLSRRHGDALYQDALGYAAAALQRAEQVLHPGSISGIQAILFLVEFAMLDPVHLDSWYLIGVASRAMVDLGLHQDPPEQVQMDKAQLDIRRRVYYCVYSLDRAISMVHEGAFSFEDDSTNVALPSSSGVTPSISLQSSSQSWLRSLEPALHLFRARLLQSAWYQELFQSSREAWVEPSPYLWSICLDMRKWEREMPTHFAPSLKNHFRLELLYSLIYALGPSDRCHSICLLGQAVVFKYCMEFASRMLSVSRYMDNKVFYTFHDATRTYFVGRRFIDVLCQSRDELVEARIPDPLVLPANSTAPLPRISKEERLENVSKALACVEQIIEILNNFGIRRGCLTFRDDFIKESAFMLSKLRSKRRDLQICPDDDDRQAYGHRQAVANLETAFQREWQHLATADNDRTATSYT